MRRINSKVFFNWSSGKDSAFALYKFRKQQKVDLLFTTVNAENKRISMHGLRENALRAQAKAIGIPLKIFYLPPSPDMEIYNRMMANELESLKVAGYSETVYGDIFLEDLKKYRETQLGKVGIKTHFPLWQRNTKELIHEFIDLGFKSCIVSANAKWFDQDFVGQTITKELIENLPKEVDPCGENGEFHTFCYDGPLFETKVDINIGTKVLHEYDQPNKTGEKVGYWFCDIEV